MSDGELFKLSRPSLSPELARRVARVPRALREVVLDALPPLREVLASFAARFAPGGDGPRILAVYVRHALQRVKEEPTVKLASDRFGHGVPYAARLEVDNSAVPLFVAAVALAAPEIAGNVRVKTRRAVLLRKSNWRPAVVA